LFVAEPTTSLKNLLIHPIERTYNTGTVDCSISGNHPLQTINFK